MIDAYRIGIALNMTSNATGVLGRLGVQLAATERQALALEGTFKRIHSGLLLLGASATLGFGLEKALKPAMEYQHQLELMKTAGMSQIEVAQASAQAWKTSHEVQTASASDALKTMRELRTVFGTTEAAMAYVTPFTKLNAVLRSVLGDKADGAFDAAKALELRGVSQSPAEFDRQMNMISQGVAATGGRILPRDYLQLFKMAAPYTVGLSDRFAYGVLPTLMQDMGASRVGTALTTLDSAFVSGRMTKASLAFNEQLGLITPGAKVNEGSAGTVSLTNMANVKDRALLISDPARWVAEVYLPALQKAGGDSPDKLLSLIAHGNSNRNSARILTDLIVNMTRIGKDERLINTAMGYSDAYGELQKNDPTVIHARLIAQFDNLMIRLTNSVLPVLLPLLNSLVTGLEKLANVAARHPTVTRLAFEAAGMLTIFTGLAGAFNILAGPLGVLAKMSGGIGTLATGLTGIAAGIAAVGVAVTGLGAALGLKQLYDHHTFFADALAGGGLGFQMGQGSNILSRVYHGAFTTPGALPPSWNTASGQSQGNVYLDSTKVGSVLWKNATQQMSTPSNSTQQFDYRPGYVPNN